MVDHKQQKKSFNSIMNQEILNDQVKPYNEHENKTAQLARLFNKISKRYDSFNDLISWGMAHSWRRKSVSYLKEFAPQNILDIATGTADMLLTACDLLQPKTITGIDISEEMMKIGERKVQKKHPATKVSFELQDASALNFQDNSFDAVTISFGIRNLEMLSKSLQEINRVLKPQGHFLIVEVNQPQKGIILILYKIYLRIYQLFSSKLLDKSDFQYLTTSMGIFPRGKQLISLLGEFNFELVRYKRFTFDVCSAYLLRKTTV